MTSLCTEGIIPSQYDARAATSRITTAAGNRLLLPMVGMQMTCRQKQCKPKYAFVRHLSVLTLMRELTLAIL